MALPVQIQNISSPMHRVVSIRLRFKLWYLLITSWQTCCQIWTVWSMHIQIPFYANANANASHRQLDILKPKRVVNMALPVFISVRAAWDRGRCRKDATNKNLASVTVSALTINYHHATFCLPEMLRQPSSLSNIVRPHLHTRPEDPKRRALVYHILFMYS